MSQPEEMPGGVDHRTEGPLATTDSSEAEDDIMASGDADPTQPDDTTLEYETGADAVKGLIELHQANDGAGAATATDDDSSKEGVADGAAELKPDETAETVPTDGTKNAHTEMTYSTRGRAQVEHALDRLAAVGDLLSLSGPGSGGGVGTTTGSAKKPSTLLPQSLLHHRDTALPAVSSTTTRMRESFLSDSLTEEERRTRTRYLPDVEGMHALRKQEIKADLALARSILGSSGTTERLKKPSRSNGNNQSSKSLDSDDTARGAMDVESTTTPSDDILSEEDRMSHAGSRTIDIGSTVLSLPSLAFVAPDSGTGAGTGAGTANKRSTPREVEAVAAFNPPRPPESIGAKKKHRMLRWERRPADIEADLSSYHKTVQRTREELKNAKDECERIATVDHQVRRHFLQHIQCMNEELARLGDEIAVVQQECVDLADLPSGRSTRTRGAAKGNVTVMRDVIQVLRTKGKEIEAKGLSLPPTSTKPVMGVGGVTPVSFVDWDQSTVISATKMAAGWLVPGDRVQTPYGQGTVVSVIAMGASESGTEPPSAEPTKTDDAMEIDGAEEVMPSNETPDKTKGVKGDTTGKVPDTSVSRALAPRVGVQLPFGTAFFTLESVTLLGDNATCTDEQIAKRWTGITETALAHGSTLDVAGMAQMPVEPEDSERLEHAMDTENDAEPTTKDLKRRLVPFGASLFPTANGRGTLLHKASLTELDEAVSKAYFTGSGVLGMRDNTGIPPEVRKREDTRQEHLILQAKVLQLRNQLYRQRRIRLLNEKTHAASQERATRVESLVAEMRMDLKSLKGRLDLEIRDLGVSDVQAESILKAYYMSLDSQHSGEASPPKRHRRLSRGDGDEDMEGSNTNEAPLPAETEEATTGTKL